MHPRADRRPYRSFFYVTGASFAVIAGLSWSNRWLDHIWPGGQWWTVLYGLAALGSFAAGATTDRIPHHRRSIWVRRAGLLLTPTLLVVRAVANIAANGADGFLGSMFLLWSAYVVVWAARLVRWLPATPDEWQALRDLYTDLRHDVDGRGPTHGGQT